MACSASDACHVVGTCDPATGNCSNPAATDGTACDDANACTLTDACVSGACTGSSPVVCAASDACHDVGTCDPATGLCSDPARPEGSACSDACTANGACQNAVCAGPDTVVCSPSDVCHVAGTCNTTTGICSNPARVDGAACDDVNACTTSDACYGGVCAGEGVPSPEEVDDGVRVAQSNGIATISWNPAPGATAFEVLRGLVSALPVGPGGNDEVCLDQGLVGTSTTDAADPDPGEGFWYVIRGTNSCGKGPHGFALQGGITIPRFSTTCP